MTFYDEEFSRRLAGIEEKGLLRGLNTVEATGGIINTTGGRIINLSSNDYLDLANDRRLKDAAIKATNECGTGATASRLMAGNLALHDELESKLARLCATEEALVFGSGFLGNLGVLNAIARRQDMIIADKLNHASLIDGMVISGAKNLRYAHNDMSALKKILETKLPENGIPIIVSDTIFSMDGDLAPVADLIELAKKYRAMLVLDEAHAIGVFGHGGGVVRELGMSHEVDFIMGTLSKSLGSYGGFAACSAVLKKYLINSARSFIYSTGLPPSVMASGIAAIDVLDEEPGLGKKLLELTKYFKDSLASYGIRDEISDSQIVPVMIGDNHETLRIAKILREEKILATAIRPPTVPQGTSRLRMSVTLGHSESDLSEVAALISKSLNK